MQGRISTTKRQHAPDDDEGVRPTARGAHGERACFPYGSRGARGEAILVAEQKEQSMEPAPSRACETKGLGRQDLPSRPKIFFFTRPDIWLNNSPRCVQVILPAADTAPNICSRASSHFQTSLDFFTMELGDDSSPIQMGTPRDNVRPQPLSATETASALSSHPPAGKGLWPL